MYDLFAKLERRNIESSNKFQRTDIEATFQNEIKAMHADLLTWRHEYKNNLIAIRGHIESGDVTGALDYLDSLAGTQSAGKILIHTGNAAVDAIVNSKLWFAKSRGIYVNAQSLFPEGGVARVSEGDLCSIIGNLLDNSIEACGRMPEGERRFINFELLVKGDNIFLSIYNSYTGKIAQDGEEFLSSKRKPYGGGIGIKYVDSILAKYEGYAMREYNNGVFFTQAMIPLLDPKGDYKRVTRHKWYNRILGNLRAYFARR
jgi:sensor histidine kinase regulating citrate/malate metabolism